MTRVKINVSGVRFEFDRNILKDKHYGRLAIMCNDAEMNGKPLDFVVDRPSDSFGAILSYYQTDGLHMPSGVCPGYFQKELEFWCIGPDALADCCSYRYHAFFDELETRQQFQKQALPSTVSAFLDVPVTPGNKIKKIRRKLWKIVDNGEKSIVAKVYFVLVIFMVLVSILSLAYSTEPYCRRPITKCELLEYMEATQDTQIQLVRQALGDPDCSGKINKDDGEKLDDSDYSMYQYYYEYDDDGDTGTISGDYDNDNGTVHGTSTIDPLRPPPPPGMKIRKEPVVIPRLTVPYSYFSIIESITLAFFTFDLMMRLASCPSVVRYFTSIIDIFDTCALIGSFVHLIIINAEKEHYYTQNWVRFITYTQIFRAFRLFRIVKNLRASRVLGYSVRQNLRDVALLAILLISGISTFSCLIYFVEDRETIVSIPEAWYWSIITMTTVGYGDISPKTGFGRFVASVCAICGVLLLAITLPMFVNSFLTLYQYSCVIDLIDKKKELKRKLKECVIAVSVVNLRATHDDETAEMENKGNVALTPISGNGDKVGQQWKLTTDNCNNNLNGKTDMKHHGRYLDVKEAMSNGTVKR